MSTKTKKYLAIFISILLIILNSKFSFAYENIELTAQNAIAIEAKTGKVLFEKNSNAKMYPASTTKVWTAYLTIKNSNDLNEIVEVKNDLSWVEPSSMFLKVGEKFTIRELLEVLMLKSANDVAVLLAEHISGSVEEFCKLMNEEAKKIGCSGTNFVNPNGLPDDNHYSTAYDMALIAKEAIKSDVLREIAKTKSISLPANDIYPYERNYTNTNKFLTGGRNIVYNGEEIDVKYDIVDGLKTGFTSVAGRCLLSTATLDGTSIIVGVFNAKGDDVYVDSRKIIDYSLERYKSRILIEKDNFKVKKELNSKEQIIEGYIPEDYSTVEDVEDADNVKNYDYDISFKEDIALPVKKDSVIGEVEVKENGKKIDTIPVLASDDFEDTFTELKIGALSVALLVICISFFKTCKSISKRRKEKRNREREYAFYKRRR